MKRFLFFIVAALAVGVGAYPALYYFVDMSGGLLASKSPEIIQNAFWSIAFYTHITLGGVALLTGWSQFMTGKRRARVTLHRWLGRAYVVACLLSGTAALYLAVHASTGAIASFGFGTLALLWIFSTARAYLSARKRDLFRHRTWMIRSFALSLAAVTLRIWMALSQIGGVPFELAYPVISWLCWVPNILLAEVIIRRERLAGGAQLSAA